MFNLIIQGGGWSEARDRFTLDRIFEYTDDDLSLRYRGGSQTLFAELSQFPCLFMEEGAGDQLARVGFINRHHVGGGYVTLEYSFDAEVPPIANSRIYELKSDLDINHDFEFSRTRWALKQIDLYRFLLRNVRPRRQMPKVFNLPEHERIEDYLVSVMMPFSAEFHGTLRSIKNAVEDAGLKCRRADEIWENPSVIQDVVALIDRSKVVICDCSGRNANVFYEAGIAHTLGREVILVTQSESDIPFDLRHYRFLKYLNNSEGRRALTEALTAKLRDLTRG